MARHCQSESIRSTTPAPIRPEGFMTLKEVDAAIKQLNKHQRRLSRYRVIRSVGDLRLLTPEESARLAHLIAGRQNRPVS